MLTTIHIRKLKQIREITRLLTVYFDPVYAETLMLTMQRQQRRQRQQKTLSNRSSGAGAGSVLHLAAAL